MHKKIFYVFIGIITICVIILLISIKPKNLEVAIINSSYNNILLNDESLLIEVDLYVNKKNSDFTNPNKIKSSVIKNDSDLISVNVQEVIFLYEAKISNKNFYKYRFKLTSDYNYNLYLNDAYLNIITDNNNYLINIGSVSIMSADSYIDNNLSINYLLGLSRKEDNRNYLVGCYVGFTANEEILVKNITFSDNNLELHEVIKIDDFDNESNDINHKLVKNSSNFEEFTINGESKFLFKFTYKELYQILDVGIKVEYEGNNGAKSMFYPKFTFFIDHEYTELVEELNFYEFKNNWT